MYLVQYNLLKSRFGSNIMFLHIWTVIPMYYVYGNKLLFIVIVIVVNLVSNQETLSVVNSVVNSWWK